MSFCLFSTVYAGIDPMQLRLLEPYSMPLRWDNIEDEPFWISGIKPEYNDDWEMETIRLAPNRQLTVFLPAYETLRFYHPRQALDAKSFDVYSSDGTGLGLKQNLKSSTDGRSLILSPNSDQPLLVHIQRKCCQLGEVELALFVSRKEPLNEIAPYRNLILSSARWCLLGQTPFGLPEIYHNLLGLQPQHFEVRGPARIALKSRLNYERTASEMLQHYRLKYWFDDDKNKQTQLISTEVEKRRVITVNESVEVVGREEQIFFEVPPGRHRLYLQADRPVYVQLLAQTERDYLFRGLNNPQLPVESIRKLGLLPSTEFPVKEQTAKTIARDNSRRLGATAASNLLRDAALKRQDYPQAKTEAEYLRNASSYYRDVMPSKKPDSGDQFAAYFITKGLQSINRPGRNAILSEQHAVDALEQLSQGYFTPLTQQGSAGANEYALPEQEAEGELRLIVDKSDCGSEYLHIEINREASNDLWLHCQPDVGAEAFVRTITEAALFGVKPESKHTQPTLRPFFAAFSEPGKLIPAAVYEVPLPKKARTLKLWRSSKPDKPLYVALQYRTTKAFTLTEQSYLSLLQSLPGKEAARTKLIDFLSHEDAESPNKNPPDSLYQDEEQLRNQWIAFKRLLFSEVKLYKSAVSDFPAQRRDSGDRATIANLTKLAQQAEDRQFWLEALEYWGEIVNKTSGFAHEQAQLHQAELLKKLGEDYLAENLFRYLTLFADDSVAEAAAAKLSDSYQIQKNDAGLLALTASMFIHRPTDLHADRLFNALMKNGEYRFALLFGLAYGKNIPSEGLLTAAYQLEWWETYDRLLDRMTPTQRAFAKGLKAQHFADFDGALKAWAGAELKNWHDYLQQGQHLRELLAHSTAKNAQTLYEQWANWQQKNPGEQLWKNGVRYIKDYAASDTYYLVERDIYSQAFRATQERPVVLKLLGPATLNLLVRPMHRPDQPELALDGWLDIADNDESYRYPYLNNQIARGLKIVGSDDFQVGNLVSLTYRVGLGWHEIKLSSEQTPVSISVQEQRPELAMTVLPPLTEETWSGIAAVTPPNYSQFSSGKP
ncbi:MAG: hypothetical protein IPN42_12475 [Methylococcaceae bacterium]|nr:hypothetical protein [Methylococcaceae bacterium]